MNPPNLPGRVEAPSVQLLEEKPTLKSDDSSSDSDEDRPPAFPAPNGPQRLAVPTSTTRLPKVRRKVLLEPGHSPLDWARLKASGKDLRGVPTLARYTLEELKKHKTEGDCWTAVYGKVYNITHYLNFHPGGKRDLMKIAGRDGTKLF
ncbi:hypothetical protein IWQ60_001494, partial [Tieghemiomyces parasiticus]